MEAISSIKEGRKTHHPTRARENRRCKRPLIVGFVPAVNPETFTGFSKLALLFWGHVFEAEAVAESVRILHDSGNADAAERQVKIENNSLASLQCFRHDGGHTDITDFNHHA